MGVFFQLIIRFTAVVVPNDSTKCQSSSFHLHRFNFLTIKRRLMAEWKSPDGATPMAYSILGESFALCMCGYVCVCVCVCVSVCKCVSSKVSVVHPGMWWNQPPSGSNQTQTIEREREREREREGKIHQIFRFMNCTIQFHRETSFFVPDLRTCNGERWPQ